MPQTNGIAARDGTNRQWVERYGLATNAATAICFRDGQEIGSGRIDGDTIGGRAGTPQISGGAGGRCAKLDGLLHTDGIATCYHTHWQRVERYGLATNAATAICCRDGQKICSGSIDGDAIGGRAGVPQISGTGNNSRAKFGGLASLTQEVTSQYQTNWQRVKYNGLATNTAATVGIGQGEGINAPGVDGDAVGSRAGAP